MFFIDKPQLTCNSNSGSYSTVLLGLACRGGEREGRGEGGEEERGEEGEERQGEGGSEGRG